MKELTDGSIARKYQADATGTDCCASDFLPAGNLRSCSFICDLLFCKPHSQLRRAGVLARVTLQACFSLWLVRGEFRQRLAFRASSVPA